VNPDRTHRPVEVMLNSRYGPFETAEDAWEGQNASVRGRTVAVDVGDRDVAVVRLK